MSGDFAAGRCLENANAHFYSDPGSLFSPVLIVKINNRRQAE